jgi:hypothetical protein
MAARNDPLPPTTQKDKPRKRFAAINKMPIIYEDLDWNIGSYRWFVFNRESNGFNACLIKIGNRWAVDLDCFESWMEEHRGS